MSNKERDIKRATLQAIASGCIDIDEFKEIALNLCYLCPSTDTEQFLTINLCAPCRELLAIELLSFKCAKCGHGWRGRLGARPDRCPECGCTQWWEKKRKYARKEGE